MTRSTKITASPPAAVQEILERLGRNIRTARMRRKLTQQGLAQRIGVTRFAVANIEKGKATTSIAAYMGALWVFGLLDQVREIADPDRDEEGKVLEHAHRPKRARSARSLSDDF